MKLIKIKVDQDCDLCGRCTHICPTGALKLTDQDGQLSLTYQAIQCINCEICRNCCSSIKRSIDTFM
ncbi:4Fe-4S binding protein [Anaerobacillus sp. HL2]|nr:4Fe-4S binding protein [Anaerobacillus sp. HL2]